MKWNTYIPQDNDIRIIWWFTLFPITLKNQQGEWETRWFELTKIVQKYHCGYDSYWENISWAN